jgi:hypothetical protein
VGLPLATWERLVIWLVIGLVAYFAYGRRHALTGTGGPLLQPAATGASR